MTQTLTVGAIHELPLPQIKSDCYILFCGNFPYQTLIPLSQNAIAIKQQRYNQ